MVPGSRFRGRKGQDSEHSPRGSRWRDRNREEDAGDESRRKGVRRFPDPERREKRAQPSRVIASRFSGFGDLKDKDLAP
jgi:hypothetical protein